MACKLCEHEHTGPCYPNCSVCCPKPTKARSVARSPKGAAKEVEPKQPAQKSRAVKPERTGGTQAERNRRYREKNRERYNAYMREYRKRVRDHV